MEQQQITPEQALNNLKQVALVYRGTAQEHVVLQGSIKVLSDIIPGNKKDESRDSKKTD